MQTDLMQQEVLDGTLAGLEAEPELIGASGGLTFIDLFRKYGPAIVRSLVPVILGGASKETLIETATALIKNLADAGLGQPSA